MREQLGTAILVVEQNAQVALDVADHAYVMENGRVVLEGTPERLRAHQDIREFYLGGAGARRSYRDVKQYRRSRRWWLSCASITFTSRSAVCTSSAPCRSALGPASFSR